MTNPLRQLQVARGMGALQSTRRQFVTATASFLAIAPLIAACGATSAVVQSAIATAVADLQNAINSFVNVASQFASIVGISATDLGSINTAVAGLKSVLSSISTTITDTSTTAMQKALTLLNTIVSTAAQYSALLPSPLNEILPAVSIVLPVIEAALQGIIGMISNSTATVSSRGKFRAMAPAMSVAKARAVLAAAAIAH